MKKAIFLTQKERENSFEITSKKKYLYTIFYHPDFTVGTGITPDHSKH
jgi:hypothetical protein